MRFKVNKEAYGQSYFQKSTKACHSESERPLTKSGRPDMRFKVNKEAYGQSYFQKSTKACHSESERPLTKSGRPDMRFKVNKEAYGQSSFQKSYSYRSSSSGSSSDWSVWWYSRPEVCCKQVLYMVLRPRMGDQATAPDRLLVGPVRVNHWKVMLLWTWGLKPIDASQRS